MGVIAILWVFHVTPTGDLMELHGFSAFPWTVNPARKRQGDHWDSYETLVYQWERLRNRLIGGTYHI
jgi:hypothetical protein